MNVYTGITTDDFVPLLLGLHQKKTTRDSMRFIIGAFLPKNRWDRSRIEEEVI